MDNSADNDKRPESTDSLEEPVTAVENSDLETNVSGAASDGSSSNSSSPPPNKKKGFKEWLKRLNIYLVGVVLITVVAIAIVVIAFSKSSKNNSSILNSQSLTPEQLSELEGSNPVVGNTNQNLTIQSNATFNGNILVRDDLDVAGTIKVGGSLNLPGITVSGTSNFGLVQANQLNVSGNINTSGNIISQKDLTINGTASFAGAVSANQITVQNLTLSGDLTLTHHLVSTGGTPNESYQGALGNGGTASISGTDTAGIITIHSGTSASTGCLVNYTFTSAFSSPPVVELTPLDGVAAQVNYYITRSQSQFSVCAVSPPSSSTFSFDYIVIQ